MKRFIITILLACYATVFFAQPDFTPKSPNAASMEASANIDVNLYTGTPSVVIPLWIIKERELTLPISLSYSGGGFKVSEEASWVGLGWNLNTGGAIVRETRGLPDEVPYDNPYRGYFTAVADGKTGGNLFGTDASNAADGYLDTQPDVFTYDFPGGSGKIFFTYESGAIKAYTIPYSKLKIEKTHQTEGKQYIEKWIITTEDGTQYVFGKDAPYDGRETTNMGSYLGNVPIAWNLIKIISPTTFDVILFKYIPIALTYQRYFEGRYDLMRIGFDCPDDPIIENDFSNYTLNAMKLMEIETTKSIITINSTGTRTDLSGNPQYAVQSILIKSKQQTNQFRKLITFTYNYFTTTTYDTDQIVGNNVAEYNRRRLRLDKIVEKPDGGTTSDELEHQFIYNATQLPPKNSTMVDYWGYYNNKTENDDKTLLPPGAGYLGANREPATSDTDLKACMLEKIIYPTGGSTEFVYEGHTYSYIINGTQLSSDNRAGGVRIKQIIKHVKFTGDSDANSDITTTYLYKGYTDSDAGTIGTRSSGVLCTNLPLLSSESFSGNCRYLYRTSNSVNDLSTTHGSNIGYEEVTVIQGDESQNNGRIYYKFSAARKHYDGNTHGIFTPYTDHGWKRGALITSIVFNTSLQKQMKQTNTYRFEQTDYAAETEDGIINRKVLIVYRYERDGDGGPFNESYKLISGWFRLDQIQQINYNPDGSNPVTTTKVNTFDNTYLQLTQEQITYPDNVVMKTQYSYITGETAAIYIAMRDSKNMVNTIKKTEVYRGTTKIAGTSVDYDYFNTNTLIAPKIISQLEGAIYVQKKVIDQYDSYGNLREFHIINDNSSSFTYQSVVYDSPTNSLPVKTGVNIKYSQLILSPGTYPSESLVTVYTYINPLVGYSTVTDANSVNTYYEYDIHGRLKIIKNHDGNIIKKVDYNKLQ